MKRFLTVFIILICLLSVIGGHFYYNYKLEKTAHAAKLMMKKEPEVQPETKSATIQRQTSDHFTNAPKGIAELYQKKIAAGETLTISLVGSDLTSSKPGTWAKLFTDKMIASYGKDITISTTSFGEQTSLQFPKEQSYKDLIKKKSDIVLIEPVLLNDNNKVIPMKDTLYVLDQMITDIKNTNPDTTIMLQPPNPIFQPHVYADQVSDLKAFAAKNEIPYLDHWEAWPNVNSEDIKQYITKLKPNEKGNKRWADFMFNLFQ
ncbi:SGNH/GDSL hydrolase family protein [Fictibacillus barbaricus]|uniref:SGNH hydrolase-type esterase domain-containing protein n=1 Tax=Fictibacillus barbaricus TaxID=182136 RepID=A0ABU1U173_9BACL|nr:SGNH/GDSL hydrolase family protein [Fictibacillus barbaricus]MDR7073209.1 hypothetical protein [Fictibacillus barbaricus]